MICACFGHHDTPAELYSVIKDTVGDLIAMGCDHFYIGHQGNFDRMVRIAVCDAQHEHPHVRYTIVLPCTPKKTGPLTISEPNTIFPEALTSVPPQYAIARRNAWMVDQADYVLLNAAHLTGGAGKMLAYARKKHKQYLNIQYILHHNDALA